MSSMFMVLDPTPICCITPQQSSPSFLQKSKATPQDRMHSPSLPTLPGQSTGPGLVKRLADGHGIWTKSPGHVWLPWPCGTIGRSVRLHSPWKMRDSVSSSSAVGKNAIPAGPLGFLITPTSSQGSFRGSSTHSGSSILPASRQVNLHRSRCNSPPKGFSFESAGTLTTSPFRVETTWQFPLLQSISSNVTAQSFWRILKMVPSLS
mmetsp:Transcript_74597/g.131945  ORF Transcript_74597/g.131945 Transcript_74597/m.131945 type:complete len:206 (-) Transcript_74597:109-726(-)